MEKPDSTIATLHPLPERIEAYLKRTEEHERQLLEQGAHPQHFFGERTMRESIRAILAGPTSADESYDEV